MKRAPPVNSSGRDLFLVTFPGIMAQTGVSDELYCTQFLFQAFCWAVLPEKARVSRYHLLDSFCPLFKRQISNFGHH